MATPFPNPDHPATSAASLGLPYGLVVANIDGSVQYAPAANSAGRTKRDIKPASDVAVAEAADPASIHISSSIGCCLLRRYASNFEYSTTNPLLLSIALELSLVCFPLL